MFVIFYLVRGAGDLGDTNRLPANGSCGVARNGVARNKIPGRTMCEPFATREKLFAAAQQAPGKQHASADEYGHAKGQQRGRFGNRFGRVVVAIAVVIVAALAAVPVAVVIVIAVVTDARSCFGRGPSLSRCRDLRVYRRLCRRRR